MSLNKCKYLDCDKTEQYLGSRYCSDHINGGFFGNGKAYERYSIIEEDFIKFIKVVPIDDPEHMKVHSPVLRDIILRVCTEIEIFFKEMGKYACSEDPNHSLLEKYNRNDKKERNWNFGDYFVFKDYFPDEHTVYVRPNNENIAPFIDWHSEKEAPRWWCVYNSIKHNGLASRKEATVRIALNCLAALFLMHSMNQYSREYLKQFSINITKASSSNIDVEYGEIKSPIESKRYLFKMNEIYIAKLKIVDENSRKREERLKKKGY